MRLKELREEFGLTQNDIASAIKTSRTNIGRWEKGENEPSASFVVQLANFFKCSTDYLLGIEDDFGNIAFTEEEKKLGLSPSHAVVLSDDDRYRIHLLAQAEETLGKSYVDGVLKMIELSIQQSKK